MPPTMPDDAWPATNSTKLAAVVAAVVAGQLAIIHGLRPLVRWLAPQVGTFPAASVTVGALSLYGLALVAGLGRWRQAGFSPPSAWRGAIAVAPLGVYTAFGVLGLAAGPRVTEPTAVAWTAVYVALIGFNEEVLYRGVIQDVLSSRGPLVGIVGSGIAFGLIHLNNALHGADPAFVALQVVAAAGTGVFFAAFRERTGTLVPLVYAHAVTDLTPLLVRGPGFGGPGTPLIEFVPFVGYSLIFAAVGLWLVRDRIDLDVAPNP